MLLAADVADIIDRRRTKKKLILMQKKNKHPKKYESGMAICDLLTILFPAPGLIYMYTLRNYDKPLGPATVCYIYYFFNETVPSLFHTASIWLTVGLAFQR